MSDILEKEREIEDCILRHKSLTSEEKESLLRMVRIDTMKSERVLDHPKETLALLAELDGNRLISEAVPQVDRWVENGEDVTMKRVYDWIIDQYDLW